MRKAERSVRHQLSRDKVSFRMRQGTGLCIRVEIRGNRDRGGRGLDEVSVTG